MKRAHLFLLTAFIAGACGNLDHDTSPCGSVEEPQGGQGANDAGGAPATGAHDNGGAGDNDDQDEAGRPSGGSVGQAGSASPGGDGGGQGGSDGSGQAGGSSIAGEAGSDGGGGAGGADNAGGAAGDAGDGPTLTATLALVSDGSWLTYGTDKDEDPPVGWNTVAFDDHSWTASVAPNPGACGTYEPTNSWERPSAPMWDVGDKYSAFFRKVVTLPEGSTVTFAKIIGFADDDIEIWINGAVVFREPDFGIVPGNTVTPNEIDLKPFLHAGPNLIAIHGQDTIGYCRWAVVSGSIEVSYAAR